MPSLEVFTEHMKKLQVLPSDEIVCYDTQGMFSVARAWFMFSHFGAHNVRILNGGLTKWNMEGRPLVGGDQVHLPEQKAELFTYKEAHPEKLYMDINKIHKASFAIGTGSSDH